MLRLVPRFFSAYFWRSQITYNRSGIEEIASGVPLGGENVILSKLQYLPGEINDFRGPEGPEIYKHHDQSSRKRKESVSPKHLFFESVFGQLFCASVTIWGILLAPEINQKSIEIKKKTSLNAQSFPGTPHWRARDRFRSLRA